MLEAPLATDLPKAPWEIRGTGHAIETHTTGYSLLASKHISTNRPRGYPLGILPQPEQTETLKKH